MIAKRNDFDLRLSAFIRGHFCCCSASLRLRGEIEVRAKRLPERPGPRGAKDSIRFRERLDDAVGLVNAELGEQDVRVVGKNLPPCNFLLR
jgi:hypothetical protein